MNTQIVLTVELRLLAYAVFICIVMWLPYTLTAIRTFGLVRMVSYPAVDYAHLARRTTKDWWHSLYEDSVCCQCPLSGVKRTLIAVQPKVR